MFCSVREGCSSKGKYSSWGGTAALDPELAKGVSHTCWPWRLLSWPARPPASSTCANLWATIPIRGRGAQGLCAMHVQRSETDRLGPDGLWAHHIQQHGVRRLDQALLWRQVLHEPDQALRSRLARQQPPARLEHHGQHPTAVRLHTASGQWHR